MEWAFLIYFFILSCLYVLFDVCSAFKSSCLFVCIVADVGMIFFVNVFVSLKRPCFGCEALVLDLVKTCLPVACQANVNFFL